MQRDRAQKIDFAELMASLQGMISLEEATFLRDAAANAEGGCIVEIGSWRGKSAVALAMGVLARPFGQRPQIYCIEPHRTFTGVYGGQFGPHDREAFYETMLSTRCAEHVALINLPSEQAAAGWREPIALLFVDGDHAYSAVRRDLDAWIPFLVPRATIIFDDASDPAGGPYRVIGELEKSGKAERYRDIGKITAMRWVL